MLVQRIFLHNSNRIFQQHCRNLMRVPLEPVQSRIGQFKSSCLHNSTRYTNLSHTTGIQRSCFEHLVYDRGPVPPSNVIKAILFTTVFTGGCFIAATVLEYENMRSEMLEKARIRRFPWLGRQRRENGPEPWKNIKHNLQQYWDQLDHGSKVFVPLCAINVLVFGLWRIPALKSVMTTYFCSNAVGRVVCWPMFLSTFSHYSVLHLFANMYVLQSFSNAAVLTMGKEQFLAMYLSAGVIASLSSIIYKAIISKPGLSLGASGAIMGVLAYVCTKYPDTQLSILFLPMLTFSAGSAIKVIIGIDLAGCLLGWKFFDHAAHFGGALFGIFWAYYGNQIWQKRASVRSIYRDIRKLK